MRTCLCLIALLVGCQSKKDDAPAPSPVVVDPAAHPANGSVEIFINDKSTAKIDAAQIATWPRLDSLVPQEARRLGTWELVSLTSDKPKPSQLSHPSSSYPDMVPAIFPGDGGGVSFGMFDTVELANKGKPGLREDNVKEIHITIATGGMRGQNDDGGGTAGDPTKLVITIKTPSGTTKLTGEQILALPREASPQNADQKGWRLTKLLEAAGVKKFDHLVLTDATGTNLTLDKKDFDDKTTIPFIKLNKKSALRFRVFKKAGEGWNPSGDLGSLTTIEVK